MSLRVFHLFFIGVSVILAAFFGAWAIGEYRAAHGLSYGIAGIASLGAGVGLGFYGAAFQRKTKRLS